MNSKDELRNRMMDYLYDEMEHSEKKEFEQLIKKQPELKKELDELRSTRDLLQASPSSIPPFDPGQPIFYTEKRSNQAKQKSNNAKNLNLHFKTLLAAAAVLLATFIGLAFAGIETGSTENGFYLTIGNPPVPELPESNPELSEERVFALMEQLQNDQTVLMAGLMDELQARQNEQINELVALLTDYYEERRQEDLRMIAEGFYQLEYETQNRFNRTNTALGSIIYALSNP